jgi:hypothetical protein
VEQKVTISTNKDFTFKFQTVLNKILDLMEAVEKLKQHFLANTTITLSYGKQKAFS